jgi:hypothetical protein
VKGGGRGGIASANKHQQPARTALGAGALPATGHRGRAEGQKHSLLFGHGGRWAGGTKVGRLWCGQGEGRHPLGKRAGGTATGTAYWLWLHWCC